MFFRSVLVCFWGQACELDTVRREEHAYAECRPGSALAEVAVADDRLKRLSVCPVPNISAKTAALVEITHRISWFLDHSLDYHTVRCPLWVKSGHCSVSGLNVV